MESSDSKNLFNKLIGIFSLIGATLFFSGWIYRWAYFKFFDLELDTLNLQPQSFFIVNIQIFFANPWITLRSFIGLLGAFLGGYFILWSLRSGERFAEDQVVEHPQRRRTNSLLSRLIRKFRDAHPKLSESIAQSNPLKSNYFGVLESFFNEIVIIIIVLIVLFWYARIRGAEDAFRDAQHCRSTLPTVALVTTADKIPYGFPLEKTFGQQKATPTIGNSTTHPQTNPIPDKKFTIIGDVELFRDLQGNEVNTTSLESLIVWRLLLEDGHWIYLFPALPPTVEGKKHPHILAIRDGFGDQLMIVSPVTRGNECA